MIEIREGQTTITKEDKIRITQRCRFTIDTYADKVRKLKLEIREMEQEIEDAKEKLTEVNKLEVV